MASIKLAQALLKRKELNEKVAQLARIKEEDWTVMRTRRIKVEAGIDEVTVGMPKAPLSELTAAYDYYAKRLRELDGLIQQANWTTVIKLEDPTILEYYVAPPEVKG